MISGVLGTSGAEARKVRRGLIAALEALRHPNAAGGLILAGFEPLPLVSELRVSWLATRNRGRRCDCGGFGRVEEICA
jgi:hypothetical protein